MKKSIGYIALIAVVGVVIAFFLMSGSNKRMRPGKELALEEQVRSIPVSTVAAVEGTIQDYIRLSGDIKAASSVAVYPDVAGTLAAIRAEEGDYVSAGEILAYVDPSRPGADYSNSPVDTPIAGTVTKVYNDVGDFVSASMPVLEVGRLEKLEIEAAVSERYVNRVAVGQQALIETDALPGSRLEAVVTEVSPVVDQTSRTMQIQLAFVGESRGVKAGMLADVTLILEEREGTVKVPQEVLTERMDGIYAFVLKGSTVERRLVETGIVVDEIAEIISGIEAGETVVASGMSMLTDGSLVQVIEEEEALAAAGNLEGIDA
jgi:multidrug efflux pump subunit AcrA (membrane-fusion protein)